VEDAKREAIPRDISNLTQLELCYLAKRMARKMRQGINGSWGKWNGLPITPEDAYIWLDIILDKLPQDERGDIVGEPPDPLLAQALAHLRSEGAVARPLLPWKMPSGFISRTRLRVISMSATRYYGLNG